MTAQQRRRSHNQAWPAMTRLNVIWKSNSMSFPVKVKLFKSLVVYIVLYGCKSWTITADLKRRIEAFEHTCYRRLLCISYTEHRTNEFVRQQVTNDDDRQEPLIATVKRRTLTWYDHTSHHDSLAKIILKGTVEGKQRRGRPMKSRLDNIKEGTKQPTARLLRMVEDRQRWRIMVVKASTVSPQRVATMLTGLKKKSAQQYTF